MNFTKRGSRYRQRSEVVIEARNLRKEYGTPDGGRTTAMHVEYLFIAHGEQVAIVGPSGSGKTTLLSILGGVLDATSGVIKWDGVKWEKPTGRQASRERARQVGFVFQDLNLIPSLTLMENLAAAEFFLGLEKDVTRASRVLRQVGLSNKADRKPNQLSRGEQQRAAIARAVLHPHPLLIADEPTASLDGDNAETAINLLCDLSRENKSTLVVATHDSRVMERLERKIELLANE